MDNASERIDMINSFELIGRHQNEKVDMHLQSNFYLLLINSTIFSILMIIIILHLIKEIFGVETQFNWNKMTVLLLISINGYIGIGHMLCKKVILKHLKHLETSTAICFDPQFNDELATLLAKLNKPLKHNLMTVILMVITLSVSIANFYMDGKFIDFKLLIAPTVLLYILASLYIWKCYKKLKANIAKVEESPNQRKY